MSLITRCPACGTMFKVVADQLKISQGWVRCGHCAEVFDAAAQLQSAAVPDLDSGLALIDADSPLGSAPPDQSAAATVPLASLLRAPETPTRDPLATETADDYASIAASEIELSLPPELSAQMFVSALSPGLEPESLVGPVPPVERPGRALDETDMSDDASAHEVSFVRDARRDAFWRRSAVRAALGLVALVLLLALLLQLAWMQKNTLALSQPWLKPGLQMLCRQFQCEIKAPQQIEAIVIDSSSFNKIATDLYRLKVVIKNSGAIAVAMPALELSLTDSQEQALLRRVLTPSEFGASAAPLAAGAEFSAVVAIQISNPFTAGSAAASAQRSAAALRISGYRVLAFYP